MKTVIGLIFLFFLPLFLASQLMQPVPDNSRFKTTVLTAEDSIGLVSLPPLELSDAAMRRSLPAAVDNSNQIFMRPVFLQEGYVCNQSATIAYLFTYELNNKRNLPSNIPENQYPDHFAFNFINKSIETAGVSYYESFEVLRKAGTPNIATYGGMAEGGYTRWMTGYDQYYQAMHNRINKAYSIKPDTPDGLQTLKNWIYDHGNGSAAGGLASFSAKFNNTQGWGQLPPNTPEAGKLIIIRWLSPADHALTIVGYNDSIRYDYNGDGQYTNHLDINGDGVVDMRDWEIGGFKLVNSYGSSWANDGYAYMMYKTVADDMHDGGIWNSMVVVADVKEDYEPLLTARIKLTHPCRSAIKIMAGFAEDTDATEPDVILHFPVFDFQGGCNPMQGPGIAGGDTIEFGLDLNTLLSYATNAQEGRYFLIVQENDVDEAFDGEILSFSIMDYSDGLTENHAEAPIAIANNAITYLSTTASPAIDQVVIQTNELPEAILHQDYAFQLAATGGTEPYHWTLMDDYQLYTSSNSIPMVTQKQLSFDDNSEGLEVIHLPFEFPFYDGLYSSLHVAVDGFIRFDESLVPWPYYIEGKSYIMHNRMIAPCQSQPFMIVPELGDGVWYELEDNAITIRWKLSESSNPATTAVNFAVKLFHDGSIEFYYGIHNTPWWTRKYAGISAGDGENYRLLNTNGNFNPDPGLFHQFTRTNPHHTLKLSPDGLLQGTIHEAMSPQSIKVSVADNNNLKAFQNFEISSSGIRIEAQLHNSTDQGFYFGATQSLDVLLVNHSGQVIEGAGLTLTTDNQEISIVNGNTGISLLMPGDSLQLENVFEIQVSEQITDGTLLTLHLEIAQMETSRSFDFMAHAPVIKLEGVQFMNTNLLITGLLNSSLASLSQAVASITTDDPYIQIINGEQSRPLLEKGMIWLPAFEVEIDDHIPPGAVPLITLQLSGDNNFNWVVDFLIHSDSIENFESANLQSFDWQTAGSMPWTVDDETSPEGYFAARSGGISHNQNSVLFIDRTVVAYDSISFFYKVSSEKYFDFLRFSVNEIEWDKWSGEQDWTHVVFPIAPGEKRFSWTYTKDIDTSVGEDAAWIDFIVFPANPVPTAVGELVTTDANLNIFPNPNTGALTIEIELNTNSTCRIHLFDASGRLIYSYQSVSELTQGRHQFRPELRNLSPGVYSILLETRAGRQVKKMIVIGR